MKFLINIDDGDKERKKSTEAAARGPTAATFVSSNLRHVLIRKNVHADIKQLQPAGTASDMPGHPNTYVGEIFRSVYNVNQLQ